MNEFEERLSEALLAADEKQNKAQARAEVLIDFWRKAGTSNDLQEIAAAIDLHNEQHAQHPLPKIQIDKSEPILKKILTNQIFTGAALFILGIFITEGYNRLKQIEPFTQGEVFVSKKEMQIIAQDLNHGPRTRPKHYTLVITNDFYFKEKSSGGDYKANAAFVYLKDTSIQDDEQHGFLSTNFDLRNREVRNLGSRTYCIFRFTSNEDDLTAKIIDDNYDDNRGHLKFFLFSGDINFSDLKKFLQG